jgi:hypothetical protein
MTSPFATVGRLKTGFYPLLKKFNHDRFEDGEQVDLMKTILRTQFCLLSQSLMCTSSLSHGIEIERHPLVKS